jgi:uncharacterized protein (TIGR03067 family)
MRTHVGFVMAVGYLVIAGGFVSAEDKEEAVKKERQKMEGTWEVVSIEIDGNKLPMEEGKKSCVVLKGDKYTVKEGDNVIDEGTGTIDPTTKPKSLDAVPGKGDNKGKTMPGIYELKGDEMRVCFARPGNARPTEFSSKNGQILLVYKRSKS